MAQINTTVGLTVIDCWKCGITYAVQRLDTPDGVLTPQHIGRIVSNQLPDGAIVSIPLPE